jgi:hypothetical protein
LDDSTSAESEIERTKPKRTVTRNAVMIINSLSMKGGGGGCSTVNGLTLLDRKD